MLRTQVEMALGELAAAGLVTSDSFTGLRALITRAQAAPFRGATSTNVRHTGCRALVGPVAAGEMERSMSKSVSSTSADAMVQRYGIVFSAPCWRGNGGCRPGVPGCGFTGEWRPAATCAARSLRQRLQRRTVRLAHRGKGITGLRAGRTLHRPVCACPAMTH